MTDLIAGYAADTEAGSFNPDYGEEEAEAPPPLELEINEISEDGKLFIKANTPMVVPGFLEVSRRRALEGSSDSSQGSGGGVPLERLDVARDIMTVEFLVRSDKNPSDLKYYLGIEEWSEEGIRLYLNFTNPLEVSQGVEEDLVLCTITTPELFVSAADNVPLGGDKLTMVQAFPR